MRLCREFGISRKTGYKWIKRYREHGSEGLKDLSRSPKDVPGRTDEEVEALVVLERQRHPTWGAKKIGKVLEVVHEVERVPARSTIARCPVTVDITKGSMPAPRGGVSTMTT